MTTLKRKFELDRYIARGFDRIAINPIRWALIVMGSAILVGGTIFSLVEKNASMPDGWWWAFVSLTTVGYGDLAPKTTEVRFLAAFVIGSGVLAIAIVTSALAGRVTQRRLAADVHATPELNDDVYALVSRLRSDAQELEFIADRLREKEEEHEQDLAQVGWSWPGHPDARR